MFALGNATFACGVRSARERSLRRLVVRRKLEDARYRRRWRCGQAHGTQTEHQLEPMTSMGIILPETGQFLMLCSQQLWQQLQRCRQTRARVQVFLRIFLPFYVSRSP